jgi:hypothetical protein
MTKIELQDERDRLQSILGDFDREEEGPQGDLDRVFGEDRKRLLISRIAYMDAKIARLDT